MDEGEDRGASSEAYRDVGVNRGYTDCIHIPNLNLSYTPNRMPANSAVAPTPSLHHTPYPVANTAPYLPGVAGSSAIARYDPYAPPRKASHSAIASTSAGLKPTGAYS